jgi:hypothetical protein
MKLVNDELFVELYEHILNKIGRPGTSRPAIPVTQPTFDTGGVLPMYLVELLNKPVSAISTTSAKK